MAETTQSFSPELIELLREQGMHVTVRTDLVGGQRDTRLHVGVPNGPNSVELLGPLDDVRLPPRWHAVRVEGERRSVWEGPNRQASDSILHAFLWELACLEYERVPPRWRRLD